MNKPDSYENVMRALEEVNDLLEMGIDLSVLPYDDSLEFKMEYAHESLTEKSSAYKRRSHNV